ncbi:MAG TPA: two-component regulator propeller domain-containing protein [Pyrinomonadaceae bacterium]|nr:two-component regulator propeller domain-containing protein [Pyrinomonadaceae bacterium]
MRDLRPVRSLRSALSLRFAVRAAVLVVCLSFVPVCGFVSFAENETDTSRAETLNEDSSSARVKNLHQWGAVSSFHGLPSDRVRAIAQDRQGVMWFGTDQGLARYDGRRVQAVVSEVLPAGRVLALKVDIDGALWVGTERGAARFLNEDFRSIKEIAGKAVTSIIAPEPGRVILSTEQGAIFVCYSNADALLSVQQIPAQALLSAAVDQPGPLKITGLAVHEGKLLAGTQSRGLLTIEGDEAKEIQSRPRAFFINALISAGDGRLWIGARAKRDESGLYMASDLMRPARIDTSTGPVMALGLDDRGDLWIGTGGRGAFRYRGTQQLDHFTFEGTAGGLRSDDIYVVFVDREGVVWFGTDRGVCRYDPRSPRIEDVSTDKQSNFVRTLYQTRDGKLLCGSNRGLFIYDEAAARWLPVQGLANRTIYAIAEDPTGKLLVGSSSGLYVNVDLQGREVEYQHALPEETDAQEEEQPPQPVESVRAIRVFQGKTHLAIFGRGIERIEGERRPLVWPNASSDARLRNVTSLHTDGGDRLWIGTAGNGVFIFDGKQATQDAALEPLRGSPVWAIDGTRDGGLWFATARGLYSYRAGQLLLVTPETDVRSVVSGVAGNADGSLALNGIWCATAGGGLLHIVNDTEFGTLVSRLDVEQGLPSQNAFAILPLRDGGGAKSLLIGTNRGVVRYSPGDTLPLLIPTRILSRRLHQPEEMRAGIHLDYPQNSLALEVAALSSRTFPEQFQYAFLLRDAAGRIIKKKLSQDSQFLIENLRPGQYQVEVRAFSKDLLASAPLNFDFSVAKAPFPWTTMALSVLLALVLIALVWAIVEHRRIVRASKALSRANRQLASARLDLANEAERERRRIARDLHDQTLADLRHLLMMVDQLPAASAPQGNGHNDGLEAATFRTEIEGVSNEIRRICEDLSPSVLENVGLTAAIEWALTNAASARSAPGCEFEYEFVCDEGLEEQLDLTPAVQMQIYRITQEVLNNICRHASATRVRLTVANSAKASFLMTIEDDGRGFDAQTRKGRKGRGLASIRARASLIEAEVSWDKSPTGGTTFTLRKPRASQATELSS